MKKMMMLAVAVAAFSFGQAAKADDGVFGAAFGINAGAAGASLDVLRSNVNKSDVSVLAAGNAVGNDGEFNGDRFNVNFQASGLNLGPTAATGTLTDSTLNGGGSIGGNANGVLGLPGVAAAGQVALTAEDKSSFNVKAIGQSVQNSIKMNNK